MIRHREIVIRHRETLIRLWMLCVVLYTLRACYKLGWTATLLESSGLRGAWGNRVHYANKGLASLAHLNVVSVALGCGVVFFVLLLVLFFLPRYRLISDVGDLFLLVGILLNLSIYTFVRYDTPFNYYASRYFLPVLVPFVVLFVFKQIAQWDARWFWVLLAPGLAFNLFYSTFIARVPEFHAQNEVIRELKEFIPRGSTVLSFGNLYTHHLFANIAIYDLESEYAYLGLDVSVLDTLPEYHSRLGSSVYLLSDRGLVLNSDAVVRRRLSAKDVAYPGGILYPHVAKESNRMYDVYRVESLLGLLDTTGVLTAKEIARLSPSSYYSAANPGWSNGVFELDFREPMRGVTAVRLITGGKYLHWAKRSDRVDNQVILEIGDEIYEAVLDSASLTFEIPPESVIKTLRIRSSTFVPTELQLGMTDPRVLGIDLKKIVFV